VPAVRGNLNAMSIVKAVKSPGPGLRYFVLDPVLGELAIF